MAAIEFDPKFCPAKLNEEAADLGVKGLEALAAIKDKTCVGSEWTGWYDWPGRGGYTLAKEILKFKEDLGVFYDLILVIGIGGSYVGTRAVTSALSHEFAPMLPKAGKSGQNPFAVFCGHNMSESGLVETLDLLEQHQPIVNVISKSGTTTEPSVAFRVIRQYMEQRFGQNEAAKRIIATTDKERGALRGLAKSKGYATFAVPGDIGGRYSVLSAVGLVPLALAGFDIESLLQGADDVFRSLEEAASEHPVIRYACSRFAAFEAGKRLELLAYSEPKLFHLVEWWKQLFGESEGKDGRGLFPAGLNYTTDLHSLGQYVQDGCRSMIETFLVIDQPQSGRSHGVEKRLRIPHMSDNMDELSYAENRFVEEINAAARDGAKVAHFDGGVPCFEVTVRNLNEFSLGALFAFFETAAGVSGAMLGVNPYDQPGVEAYKKNLFGILGKPGFEEIGSSIRKRL